MKLEKAIVVLILFFPFAAFSDWINEKSFAIDNKTDFINVKTDEINTSIFFNEQSSPRYSPPETLASTRLHKNFTQAKHQNDTKFSLFGLAGINAVGMGSKKSDFFYNAAIKGLSYGINANLEIAVGLATPIEYAKGTNNTEGNQFKLDLNGFAIFIGKRF